MARLLIRLLYLLPLVSVVALVVTGIWHPRWTGLVFVGSVWWFVLTLWITLRRGRTR